MSSSHKRIRLRFWFGRSVSVPTRLEPSDFGTGCNDGQVRIDPDPGGSELVLLEQYLDYQRETMLSKTDGLTQEQLVRKHPPSELTLAGLLYHLSLVEEDWFEVQFSGLPDREPWACVDWDADPNWEFRTAADLTPEQLRTRYRTAIERSRRVVSAAPGLDQMSVKALRDGRHFSLGWVLLHLKLVDVPFLQPDQVRDSLHAYQLAKRGNSLRVMAEAVRWGERGARINTISPGIVITPLARDELAGPRGDGYRRMIESSPVGRAGTPDEVGAVGALLMGPDGGFITGSDILMDGGVTAAYWYGEIPEVRS